MMNNKKRKLARLNDIQPDTMSAKKYNAIIGGIILYGFILNAIMIYTCADFFAEMNIWAFLIGYFVLCIIGIVLSTSKSPVLSFLGYNLVVVPIGAVVCVSVPQYDSSAILSAIIATATVIIVMITLSTLRPQFFAGMGRMLFFSLLASIVVEIIFALLGYGGDIFNWLFVVIFSLYLGYDWHKAQMYPKTLDNAIDSALDIYLDIINIFIRLLEIFAKDD